MAASPRSDLRDEVIYILGNRTELNANADNWVRRAYQHITQSIEFPEADTTVTRTTTVGLRTVALPDDYFSMYGVRNNTTDKRVIQARKHEYDALPAAETGPVERYLVVLRTLYIHPTPVSVETLQLQYRKFFGDLTDDTSVHLLPDVWDQAIVLLASSYGFDHTNEIERARHYRGQVRGFIREQQPRLAMELFDRDEAIGPIGMEI